MKLQPSIFWFILALVLGIALTNVGIVYSQDSNPVLEQAQKSLQAKFNSSSSAVGQSPPFSSMLTLVEGGSSVEPTSASNPQPRMHL